MNFKPMTSNVPFAAHELNSGTQRRPSFPSKWDGSFRSCLFLPFVAVVFATLVQTDEAPSHSVSPGSITAGAPALRPPVSPLANVEEFSPIEARYIRMIILKTNGNVPCLDEFEVFTAGPDPRNVGHRDAGAIPSASGSFVLPDIHRLRNINDGVYGNESSWLAGPAESASVHQTVDVKAYAEPVDAGKVEVTLSALLGGWKQQEDAAFVDPVWLMIELPTVARIDKVVWSRDRHGVEITRTPTEYRIETATTLGEWFTVASSDDREAYPELIAVRPSDSKYDLSFDSWSLEDGLPANNVKDIAQTADGYLWIGTDKGLARFDGYNFKSIDWDPFSGLKSPEIRQLMTDKTGSLWVILGGREPEGNNVIVYNKGRFTRLDTEGKPIESVRFDAGGTPWLATGKDWFPWRNGRLDLEARLDPPGENASVGFLLDRHNRQWEYAYVDVPRVKPDLWTLQVGRHQPTFGDVSDGPILGAKRAGGGAWILTEGLWYIPDSTSLGLNRWRELLPEGRLSNPRPLPWLKRSVSIRALCGDRDRGHPALSTGQPDTIVT